METGIPERIQKLILCALLLFPVALTAEPRVVVSVGPVHALVAGVMQGVGEPELLIRGGQSPHTFTLSPSIAQKLSAADLVVWVGEGLEAPLEKTLEANAGNARVIALTRLPGMKILPTREGGGRGLHQTARETEEGVAHHLIDPHIWLSPENAAHIVAAAAEVLQGLDPGHADAYRQNARRLALRLRAMDLKNAARLAPVRDRPYIVFHDAYQYFERHYQLEAVAAVTVSPSRMPGARRIADLRARIKSSGARCVFSEPQFEPRLVATLLEGTGARTGVLDPLGSRLAHGPEAYFTLMNNLTDALVECLGHR